MSAPPESPKLENSVTGAYWIGGDAAHEEGDNHYAQDSVVARLQTIADSMQSTVNGTTLYLQYNDASLPDGGTFSVPAPQVEEHPYSGGQTGPKVGSVCEVHICPVFGISVLSQRGSPVARGPFRMIQSGRIRTRVRSGSGVTPWPRRSGPRT